MFFGTGTKYLRFYLLSSCEKLFHFSAVLDYIALGFLGCQSPLTHVLLEIFAVYLELLDGIDGLLQSEILVGRWNVMRRLTVRYLCLSSCELHASQ